MGFNDELRQLINNQGQCLSKLKKLEAQKQNELVIAYKQITEKYSMLSSDEYQKLSVYDNMLNSYCDIVAQYSYFNVHDIGRIIASLVRVFEGVSYIYQSTYYSDDRDDQLLSDDIDDNEINGRLRIVLAEEDRADSYSDEMVQSLVKNGKAIVLNSIDTDNGEIPFYRSIPGIHFFGECVCYGGFGYVKEFIDELISYKIENKLETMSFKEMESIKVDFIVARVEQIEENYRVVDERQEEQMKCRLNEEKIGRQLTLEKIKNKRIHS